ncbi:copper chaperone PCu(A)C [Sphingomonas sp. G124]|uniref:Copper chaperone PCu(A)C n=1 Tax=Sphingomonas cremea TaxID=2904799 RepID=A0A9X1QKE2_9SPHN|nr:copper chaperone PCu(A)C [Sphingomonas cremea]MCF2513558.1 copper chaperone PCu(A)C [Sphingomonas cremea]
MIRQLLLPALLVLAACGQQGSPDIELHNAWARPTVGQAPAAVYVTIDNKSGSDDRLTGAFSDHAAMAMVHQNEFIDGVSKMRMAGEINIPAGETIEMTPGGTHVMLEGLRAPLKPGDRFDLVLRFKESGDKTVKVTVMKPEGQ